MTDTTTVFSQEQINKKLATVQIAKATVAALTATDQASAQVVSDWLGDLQDEAKAIEAMKQSALKPLRQTDQTIRGWFREVETAIAEAIAAAKQILGRYELDTRDKQREAFAEAAVAHNSGDNVAARDALQVCNELAAKRKAKGASAREVWRAEIVDAAAVPRDWCLPDEKRIAAMARATPAAAEPTPIAGVSFVRDVVVVGRPRKK